GLALAGVILKAVFGIRYPKLSTVVYILMGWLVLVAAKPLLTQVPTSGLVWLLAGGLAYTGGVFFYGAKNLRYSHFVWHLFVLAGSCCHFIAVLHYSA
ncbi:MAG: hemolysin III family protein, partial [Gemmatimonadota bacterium]|nr:hemolysin III family protein [Gemmatimonadota bacterium]